MNELFHELYSAYYTAAEQLVRAGEVKRPALWDLLSDYLSPDGVTEARESILAAEEWSFLEARDGGVFSLVSPVERPLTNLERAFLRAAANDPRAALFLTDEQLERMKSGLGEGPELPRADAVTRFDRARGGDPYADEAYRAHARLILAAMDQNRWVSIDYTGSNGNRTERLYQPFALEYSGKDDRFRVKCYREDGRESTLNMVRIQGVRPADAPETEISPKIDECEEPLLIEVLPERNGVARFLQEFSYLRKETELDEETGVAKVRLWYPQCDENEIIIRLLGFGPVLRVLEPARFVQQMRLRVRMQAARLRPAGGSGENGAV